MQVCDENLPNFNFIAYFCNGLKALQFLYKLCLPSFNIENMKASIFRLKCCYISVLAISLVLEPLHAPFQMMMLLSVFTYLKSNI